VRRAKLIGLHEGCAKLAVSSLLTLPAAADLDGLLKGLITFTAEEHYREWARDGVITMRKSPEQVRVTAHVAVQMGHRVRNAEPVPGH
jgi:hypothetical protein